MKLVLVQPTLAHTPDAPNTEAIERLLAPRAADFGADTVVLLPERFHLGSSPDAYARDLERLARQLGAIVVGGSHYEARGAERINTGLVVDGEGRVLARYDKLRPYSAEQHWVSPGERLGELVLAGRRALVLVCADFWFSDLFARAESFPELVLAPALSVTRKPTPDYSRALWRHLAIARAYEFGAFIGVSDWSHASLVPLPASGVGGFADPTATDPARFFTPIGEGGVLTVELDFDALERFREDRRERGFFGKPGA